MIILPTQKCCANEGRAKLVWAMPNEANILRRKLNRIGKAVFVIPPLCSQKHSHKGKTSSLKKSPHLVSLRVVFFRLPLWLTLPHSFLRSGWCSSWRVSLFCSPRSVIPQSWLHLPPKTPLRYSLTLIIFLVGVSHHLEFCSPAVAHAVTVCHIFCNSLFMLANCRVRSVFSFI